MNVKYRKSSNRSPGFYIFKPPKRGATNIERGYYWRGAFIFSNLSNGGLLLERGYYWRGAFIGRFTVLFFLNSRGSADMVHRLYFKSTRFRPLYSMERSPCSIQFQKINRSCHFFSTSGNLLEMMRCFCMSTSTILL